MPDTVFLMVVSKPLATPWPAHACSKCRISDDGGVHGLVTGEIESRGGLTQIRFAEECMLKTRQRDENSWQPFHT
jgi:hypothetical protein